ncbi:hypothetical protein [Portibacter lacus]|uniref:hypothetical protein n=1 Tax=Portibacter lacus TaxID=1099794 RepID=UPI001F187158|nr:hypothetical protein [Portibacter lacus]
MKKLIKVLLFTVLPLFAFLIISPSPANARMGDDLMVIAKACPGGGTYDVCWAYCGGCYCNPSSQTLCN